MNVAGIVSHNPDLPRLKRNLDAIAAQVDFVFVFDNGSNNVADIQKLILEYQNIRMIKSKINVGMATALNQMALTAEEIGAKWILTLDQDSICAPNTLEVYSKYVDIPNIGIIAPEIELQGHNRIQDCADNQNYCYIERCITSASYINIQICKDVGMFDEILFIDYVDHEYCKRLIVNGYKIICTGEVVLKHIIGSNRPFPWSAFLHKHFGTKLIYHEHSAFRVYYIIRNAVYYIRKYHTKMTFREKIYEVYAIFHTAGKHILVEKGKVDYLRSMFKGLRDGFAMKIDYKGRTLQSI